ncbi:hypothetical protein THAOC_31544 [Thalassiosira oceanica]|uniref:Uncharacterized protein n=1 Tax=Thalassiosira oceanica TaxID=159749 RepID=K0R7W6_THAOC|nr:hypothetical protein THAOC_31544 [Thalassiosira oceanica]|eukprot:EJK49568.1 hypothetical protein THAOC_31544 [Thalassiosira oceanica]
MSTATMNRKRAYAVDISQARAVTPPRRSTVPVRNTRRDESDLSPLIPAKGVERELMNTIYQLSESNAALQGEVQSYKVQLEETERRYRDELDLQRHEIIQLDIERREMFAQEKKSLEIKLVGLEDHMLKVDAKLEASSKTVDECAKVLDNMPELV